MTRRVTPERLEARERQRHDHDQNAIPDLHGRERSVRASAEFEQQRSNRPKAAHFQEGEISEEEQYRTDGEASNFKVPIEDQFGEYPRYGNSINKRSRNASHSFRGVGPKGYKRSDQKIEEEICEAIAEDAYIDASDITVSVENGEVHLTGNVVDREDRFAVEMIVDGILGVQEIINDLKVKKEQQRSNTFESTEYI